jgi:hypothetical protein
MTALGVIGGFFSVSLERGLDPALRESDMRWYRYKANPSHYQEEDWKPSYDAAMAVVRAKEAKGWEARVTHTVEHLIYVTPKKGTQK